MKSKMYVLLGALLSLFLFSYCDQPEETKSDHPQTQKEVTAESILGQADYLAISYGGYREKSRDIQPTVEQVKEDMKILAAMNVKLLRTYNTKLKFASTVLEAIHQLKKEIPSFEMYVMLGAWMDCENAFTDHPNHDREDEAANRAEIQRAVQMANQYPDIVKIIAVGNEAMVKWAASYFVQPGVILRWVNHLQDLKKEGQLPKNLWVTSSDNFASWGGGDAEYHTKDLEDLIKAVDFISLHTYPMHDTHYNPDFWGIGDHENELTDTEKINRAMERARDYAKTQYQNTVDYVKSLGVNKPVHIGETGWATSSNGFYGNEGSKATDEYKSGIYYQLMREWTNTAKISCFYFEAFDEPWKDAGNAGGSENHFGLLTVDGKVKYPLWDLFDRGAFKQLSRQGNPLSKTYDGDKENLIKEVMLPPSKAFSH